MTALLREFGYIPEAEVAAGIGLTEGTLATYRKQGVAPDHCEVARAIYYSKEAIAAWLKAGGSRGKDQ
ncbi:hypothetical protein JQ543_13670 [Bradyrhizobium diazoefficiens]|nr:hypothetical protein [Bradyrhizobium diazoefficiens]MBR0848796.1 hypothetical protein [Bradyrhizobium diazoefficiens]